MIDRHSGLSLLAHMRGAGETPALTEGSESPLTGTLQVPAPPQPALTLAVQLDSEGAGGAKESPAKSSTHLVEPALNRAS
jgi:hypothetical protein